MPAMVAISTLSSDGESAAAARNSAELNEPLRRLPDKPITVFIAPSVEAPPRSAGASPLSLGHDRAAVQLHAVEGNHLELLDAGQALELLTELTRGRDHGDQLIAAAEPLFERARDLRTRGLAD